ncbi:kelch-like protein 41 [Neocloeon triangulifer]|uniref:kelch-like protein 41 n=1 Tax=Neocloeon triangulifer TaxID=2078957 RepID=UPI00286F4A42|nr:kelch-like protein 41 [Neocloeon triangulifer]
MTRTVSKSTKSSEQVAHQKVARVPYFLHRLYENKEGYDCTFKVAGKIFQCHKQLLAWASPVFKVMFEGPFAESSNGPDDPIPIDHMTPEGFELCLKYLYKNERQFPPSKIGEVHYFANLWQIADLEEITEGFLSQTKAADFCESYAAAKESGNKVLMNFYMKKICSNFKEVTGAASWPLTSAEIVADIYSQEDFKFNIVSEAILFENLVKWGGKKRTREVRKLAPLIHFFTWDQSDSYHTYRDELRKVFNEKERSLIRICSSLKDNVMGIVRSLPDEFCKSRIERTMHQGRYEMRWKYKAEPPLPMLPEETISSSFKFWVEDEVYLLGIYHYIVDVLYLNHKHNYEVVLKEGNAVLNQMKFFGLTRPKDITSNQRCTMEFSFPTRLKADVAYEIVVFNKGGVKQRMSTTVTALCASLWKNQVANLHMIGGNCTGEIFGLAVGRVVCSIE